ncbi:SusD/RagB family nutrient-binding outer membrane lipoprotein [Flavivirga aquimarina]|uniref:SusD/RagB family nutrient-binding outer membrane lipoprotein n=1 Tax=Flavivirga aquimarina TaxID=2027862 RepID=A0ABT8W5G8_9FLAO|nr:SusD/RagB family nutrient-binding outer membrane lipoprotein [Flavivirga aquimarina]MDO5968358.1 SusD/RagB family nutrient-binding outer membrane lipoprotein [Flavivirga aquimarina]
MKNIVLKIKYAFLLVLIMFSLNACDSELADINVNPLAATSIPPDLLFPEVIVNFSSVRTIEFAGWNMHAQQWCGSGGTWRARSRYILGVPSLNNGWTGWYTTCLKNLSLVELLVETDKPQNQYIIGQSKILEGFIYSNLTQVWGEIPFTEAVNPVLYPFPKYDSQETVMEGIITLMDEGVAILEQDLDSDIITDSDLIFKGDKQAWIRWANSIKLKMLMFLANKKDVSSRLQGLVSSPLIFTKNQEAKLAYSTTIGNENQRWRFIQRFWGGNINLWFAGKPLVDLMNNLNDPRLATYFDLNRNNVYEGKVQGQNGFANISKINVNNILPDSPDRFSTASETYFLLADAAANGYISGGLAQANTWFIEGVQLALDYFDGSLGEISQTDKDTYMASLPDLTTLTTAEALDYINDQHYISLFGNGLEAWNLWKRTKSVDFDVPANSGAVDVIRRYTYPTNEAGSNPNTPEGVTIETPMWFEK